MRSESAHWRALLAATRQCRVGDEQGSALEVEVAGDLEESDFGACGLQQLLEGVGRYCRNAHFSGPFRFLSPALLTCAAKGA